MEDCRFAFQFLVDSVQIFNICFDSFEIFKKNGEYFERDMALKPTKRNPDELYEEIFNIFNQEILDNLEVLLEKTSNDQNVEIFVPKMIQKLITNIRMVNRAKMERIITVIKLGINPNCNSETMKVLCDLEQYIDVFYPPNRQILPIEEKVNFINDIFTILKHGNDKMDKLVENIDITKTSTTTIKDLLNKRNIKSNDILKILGSYGQKLPTFEPPMVAVNSFNSVINIINNISGNKKINFSQLCISNVLRGDEMYIYYYGYVDTRDAGCFSIDFIKLKNIIKGNYPYYIFYFVTCSYCLNNKDNILGIIFDIESNEVPNMFLFLSEKYLSLFREKIKGIEEEVISVNRIFKHLDKFLNNIIL